MIEWPAKPLVSVRYFMLGILVFLLGLGLIFVFQNRQPVVLTFLGASPSQALFSLQLPLGLWVVLFIVAGVLTSLLISGLIRISQPTPAPAPQRPRRTPPRRAPSPPPPASPPPSANPAWQWDNPVPEVDDWIVEEWPPEPMPPRPTEMPPPVKPAPEPSDWKEDRPEPMAPPTPPPVQLRQFEASQTPQKTERQGTIYSVTYRDAQTPRPQDRSGVYDANYRVLNAPATPDEPANDTDSDEDWI
ncbi:LapA family protein [Synechocystis sp. LKSZ1]|uniref:LapA family protein n=1 Tax=Synechocystis sp. LKSZ1 TaxID=3144951 RepID=UPI00336BE760